MTQRVRETPSKVGQHRQAEATEAAWKSGDDVERAPSQRNAAMTDSAFDALVRDIDAWFAAPGKGYVPVKGFALVARGNSGKWTDAESRAYAALEGLKKLDDASLSLLRSFCWRGGKNRSSDAYVLDCLHRTLLGQDEKELEAKAVATNAEKKRRADDQATRDDALKKAKVAAISDEIHGLRQELARRDAFECKMCDKIHELCEENGHHDDQAPGAVHGARRKY